MYLVKDVHIHSLTGTYIPVIDIRVNEANVVSRST